ncbi:hypothetical protein GCM10020000_04330 [Streptomyces olivoverticillatus]
MRFLKKQDTVQPPEWFQAMLTQGVLLLNAALTASSDSGRAAGADRHTAFWRPVAERIVEEILKAKQDADEEDRGVVFAWWGAHARNLKKRSSSNSRRSTPTSMYGTSTTRIPRRRAMSSAKTTISEW